MSCNIKELMSQLPDIELSTIDLIGNFMNENNYNRQRKIFSDISDVELNQKLNWYIFLKNIVSENKILLEKKEFVFIIDCLQELKEYRNLTDGK